jgi:predicted short-subunit dehydrogenase-like oxidoreductase (DUF2520 family)
VKPSKRTSPPQNGVAIVGPGRLGQALGRLLAQAKVPVLFVAARRASKARQAVRFIGRGRPLTAGPSASALAQASVVLLTTSDGAVASVAKDIAGLAENWAGRVVLHTSGSLPSSALLPLKRRGASVGSLHPFQTVPSARAGVRSLKGCYWGVEGAAQARKVASRFVRLLGGVEFPVRPERKTLYHAAAFLSCPTIVTLMERSRLLLQKSGVPARLARPMLAKFVAETARNFADLGARRALTGPAVRGDWETIRRHLTALRRSSPKTVPVYMALLREMLRLAGRQRPPGGLV